MCFPLRRTLSLVICVSGVEEHISLGMKTHSTRDICKAHSTRDMCKGGTRISGATHITVTSQWYVFPVQMIFCSCINKTTLFSFLRLLFFPDFKSLWAVRVFLQFFTEFNWWIHFVLERLTLFPQFKVKRTNYWIEKKFIWSRSILSSVIAK